MQMSTKLLLFVTCFHFQSGFCCPSSHSETTIEPSKSTTVPLSETSTSKSLTTTSMTTMSMKMFITFSFDYENIVENGSRLTRKLPDGELAKNSNVKR